MPKDDVGRSLFLIGIGGAIIGIIIQPTVGYISDYTVSRWGRRKPYIVFGSLLDVVFLLGIATGNSVLDARGLRAAASVSTNIARGPFQGYVPDLVAEPQVGMASGMVGLMQVVGNVTGFLLVSLSVSLGVMELSLVAVALVELVTMASVVLKVGKGMPPKPRHGKSWTAHRPGGLGDRHPPGAVVRLAARVPAAVPGRRLAPRELRPDLPRACLRHVEGGGELDVHRRPDRRGRLERRWRSCRPRGCPIASGASR